jgi:hypothetical protein
MIFVDCLALPAQFPRRSNVHGHFIHTICEKWQFREKKMKKKFESFQAKIAQKTRKDLVVKIHVTFRWCLTKGFGIYCS